MRRRGFTLIELLVVIAIIAILAAIAVPNFLEAQTRAKVSRVKSDLRTMATAVELYRVDNNDYPLRQLAPNNPGLFRIGDLQTKVDDLSGLTTPISYITSLPQDVFQNFLAGTEASLEYFSPAAVSALRSATNVAPPGQFYGWKLFSVGPDGLFGTAIAVGNYPPQMRLPPPIQNPAGGETWFNEYDPTNGTISPGNITRFSVNGATSNDAYFN